MPARTAAASPLHIQSLFPVALAQAQLHPDPMDLAIQLQALHHLRGEGCSNPDPGCAWTGDLHGVWQLHTHPSFSPLAGELSRLGHAFLDQLGFQRDRVSLHIQRCWPVISEADQVVGRHYHPNAHLSGVYYFTGDGSGRQGCLRLFPSRQVNELVPGMAVGHDGPLLSSPWCAGHWDLPPRAGLFVLFPSCLEHAVLPNQDPDALRCSLSIDFVLTAPPGQHPPEYLAPHPSAWQAC
ncbi:TIGR02466 family protein [Cyanobium sp. NIES-981]|uniref:TIGR02466 family protein n=1 Tax=Cyanobium sp. NIES-981 TaxID=1851505 RepID=UPI0007DD8382|nr:TIGR02466 family protein [Cyanobium sp. NIES-981]SBO44536.1 conserved protein of unknown function [Cyanobium sp. NIES-981]